MKSLIINQTCFNDAKQACDGKTNLEYISKKNLTKIATEIRNVFFSLQNNKAI